MHRETEDITSVTQELSFSSEDFNAEIYSDVANRAKLLEVALTRQTYDAKHSEFLKADKEGKLFHEYSGEPLGVSFWQDEGLIVGGYRWDVSLRSGRKKAVKLTAEYMIVYGGLEDARPEYAKLYFNKLARFTSYPYFRSVFAVATANSGLKVEPLPSLTDRMD